MTNISFNAIQVNVRALERRYEREARYAEAHRKHKEQMEQQRVLEEQSFVRQTRNKVALGPKQARWR